MNANQEVFQRILNLTKQLTDAKIYYEFRQIRPDALMIDVHVPGERWEIEFVDYGDEVQMEIERYLSSGQIGDESLLEELFAKFSDKDEPVVTLATNNGATVSK